MIPACHNRPPFTGRWLGTGRVSSGAKPVFCFQWPWFADRCGTRLGQGVGPNGENYADANGYECAGCRWFQSAEPSSAPRSGDGVGGAQNGMGVSQSIDNPLISKADDSFHGGAQ